MAQGEGAGALLVLIPAFLGLPRRDGVEVRPLLGGEAGWGVVRRADDGEDVDADQFLGMGLGQPCGDSGAQISSVRRVPLEAEFVAHQPVPELMGL